MKFVAAIVAALLSVDAIAADAPPGITLQSRGRGAALTDESGFTLYIYLKDTAGKPTCSAVCAEMWPPVIAADDAVAFEDWSIVARDDGMKQWAFRNQPLYRFKRDRFPGDSNGEEFNGLWRAALKPIPLPVGFGVMRTVLGHVLVDHRQMTAYIDNDNACDRSCRRRWTPMAAPALAQQVGDMTVMTDDAGNRQWAFRGQALYTHAGDVKAGDVTGDGVDKRWRAVVLEPPLPRPGWVKLQQSDSGELFANAKGMTLYTFGPPTRLTMVDIDFNVPVDWTPAWAEDGAERVADWSPAVRPDGRRQWTYRGLAVFTNDNDVRPGDVLGVRSSDTRFAPIMRNGVPMQGIGQ